MLPICPTAFFQLKYHPLCPIAAPLLSLSPISTLMSHCYHLLFAFIEFHCYRTTQLLPLCLTTINVHCYPSFSLLPFGSTANLWFHYYASVPRLLLVSVITSWCHSYLLVPQLLLCPTITPLPLQMPLGPTAAPQSHC